MIKKTFIPAIKFKAVALLFVSLAILTGESVRGFGQNPVQVPDSVAKDSISENAKEIVKETAAAPTDKAPNDIKVVFDDTAPGIVYIVSNGEKIRVDTMTKTFEKVPTETQAQTTEIPKATEPAANVEPNTTPKDESIYDFDPGEEPFDYHIINVPTPKKVPKHSLNLSFNHRFSQPINPIRESARTLLGFDSFSISSFSINYGITDKLYVSASRSPICQRGLCRTIEIGLGYHWLDQNEKSPIALNTYASVEGNGNFTEEYNYNLQTMISRRFGKRVYLFFSPALHINSNGQNRFNPRPQDFFPPATVAGTFRLPRNTVSYGFGTTVMITPTTLALFEFVPRTGFKLGQVSPIFDNNFNVVGFENKSEPAIGFGVQKNVGKHSFALTFTNTQTTTTSRYNSSNLVLSPKSFIVGFNLFRRFN